MRTKHSFMVFVAAAVLAAASVLPAFSQDSGWYYDKPIKTITFENLKNVKQNDLEGITSSFVGQKFTDEVISSLYDRMFALDYFENVEAKVAKADEAASSVKIILAVTERPVVSAIIFKGNSQLRKSELQETILIKEKDIFVQSKLLADERALRNHYIEKGYTAATVSSSFETQPSGIVVTFNINEGQRTVVRSIKFNGIVNFSEKTLKSKITLKEAGLFNKGSFQEASLSNDARIITTYYQNHGYADARVLNVKKDSSFNSEKNLNELTITFDINEGEKYKFGGMTFQGNKVFSSERLQTLVRLPVDAVYNETKFQESKMAIQNLYYENGYTSNRFDTEMKKSADSRIISYVLHITENSRSHIEDILIKGNTKTKEYVIRREIPIEPGDIFSNTKITNGLRNLYNLQYFSAVAPEVSPGSEENLVDLVFSVEEQSTTSLDFGFTFSGVSNPDDFPIALYAKIQDSNLFGEGRSLSAGTTLSTDEQSVNIGYGQNWLFGKPISTNFSLGYSHSNNYTLRDKFLPDGSIDDDYYYMEYEQHEFNLSASLGHRWTPDFAILTLSGGLSGSIINNIYDSSIYIPYDSSVSQYNNNWEPKNSLWSSFSMDGRNINYDPSSGWFFSQRLAWYGILPEGAIAFAPRWGEREFYLRTDSKVEKYFTLVDKPVSENWSFKLVLMGYSGLSFQFPFFDSAIKQSNQLYIDGMFNGRGWSVYNNDGGRGQALWSNIIELRMPVVPGAISFDAWFDAVAIKDSAQNFFTELTSEDWYFSFGPSVRFTIQQFPLRLLFTNTFQIKDGEVVFENRDGTGDNAWYKNWNFVLSFNLVNR